MFEDLIQEPDKEEVNMNFCNYNIGDQTQCGYFKAGSDKHPEICEHLGQDSSLTRNVREIAARENSLARPV